jgi:hypothetical protein
MDFYRHKIFITEGTNICQISTVELPLSARLNYTWDQHSWTVYDISTAELYMISAQLNFIWYQHSWTAYDVSTVELHMMSAQLNCIWYQHSWTVHDISTAELHMISAQLYCIWCQHSWTAYDISTIELHMISAQKKYTCDQPREPQLVQSVSKPDSNPWCRTDIHSAAMFRGCLRLLLHVSYSTNTLQIAKRDA